MLPIILIGAGILLLAGCQSHSEEAPIPHPHANPPPPPQPHAPTVFQNLHLQAFTQLCDGVVSRTTSTRATATDTHFAQTLSNLQNHFRRAYRINPTTGDFTIQNSSSTRAFKSLIIQMSTEAIRDPQAAAVYNRPEFLFFHYLASNDLLAPEDRVLLYRLHQGSLAPLQALRQINERSLQEAQRYSGTGEAPAIFERRNRLCLILERVLGLEVFRRVADQSAREIVENISTWRLSPSEQQEYNRLREIPDAGQLYQEFNRVSGSFYNPRLLEGEAKKAAFQRMLYIQFLLPAHHLDTAESLIADNLYNGANSQDRRLRDFYNLKARFQAVLESPDDIDDAVLHHQAVALLEEFFRQYLALSPQDKISPQTQELRTLLIREDIFGVYSSEQIRNSFDRLWNQSHQAQNLRQGSPVPWASIQNTQTATEVLVEELPEDWRLLASRIRVSIPNGDGTRWEGSIWNFIQQNIKTVLFVRRPPAFLASEGPYGTIDLLSRTAIIPLEVPTDSSNPTLYFRHSFEALGALAHESFHSFSYYHLRNGVDRYAQNTLGDERNADTLELEVLLETLRAARREQWSVTERQTSLLRLRSVNYLMSMEMANHYLGYPEEDRSVRVDIAPQISEGFLSARPIDLTGDFLSQRHLENPDAQRAYIMGLQRQITSWIDNP
ncbi:MAG: hypothetical protein HQM15_10220 [Deltaproteobacteria bacterium]|nr:hypothetical protein [Deltaproteobacteria bacterium]